MRLTTLLSIEIIKLKSYRNLINLLVYIVICIAVSFVVYKTWSFSLEEKDIFSNISILNPFGRLLSMFAPHLAVIITMFYIKQIGREYKYGLNKKNITDGMSRNDLFNSKLISILFYYFIAGFLFLIVFIFYSLILLDGSVSVLDLLHSFRIPELIRFFIYILFYGIVAHLLVTLTRSSSASILTLLGILFIEYLVLMSFPDSSFSYISTYLPLGLAKSIRVEDSASTLKIIMFLSYTLVFLGYSQYSINKRDL